MNSFLFLIIGFILLYFGGEFLVKGSVNLSSKLNISKLVAGMTIVSFATSSPELFVSIEAIFNESSDIVLGNIIGSNIANIALVLGCTALFFNVKISEKTSKIDYPFLFFATISVGYILYFLGEITFFIGIILLMILLAYLFYILSNSKEQWVFKNDRFSKVTDNGSFKEVKIYDLDENGDVGSIVLSKNLEIVDDEWVVKEVNDYKENISKSDFVWEDAPKLAMDFYNKSFKDMSLTENYYYWQSANEVADRNKIGYEFWKKLLEPISLICLIIFALGISLRAIGRDKSVDRFVLGILIAFGFNLLIKIFGNIFLILGWSAFWGILLSSLLLLYFGIRIIRRV